MEVCVCEPFQTNMLVVKRLPLRVVALQLVGDCKKNCVAIATPVIIVNAQF